MILPVVELRVSPSAIEPRLALFVDGAQVGTSPANRSGEAHAAAAELAENPYLARAIRGRALAGREATE